MYAHSSPSMLTFEQFTNLFEIWLKQQAKTLGGADHMMTKLGQPGVAMSKVMTSPLKYGTMEQKPQHQENNAALPPSKPSILNIYLRIYV